ncbi:MAG: DNA (cytosine-5-)-methyltransferase [candidate division Zixibacteria bacterium]|nr:DNA (cytosine-5-)-methyltransferase [candidate division Zixibacteria bacterium]
MANKTLKFVDLFCGIGGFHLAVKSASQELGLVEECVWACDIDKWARETYSANFGIQPAGDITEVNPKDIPDHDLLCAGFPCQPFSVFGKMRGFEDTRGTLFFEIARALKKKKPRFFILENVKQLVSHRGGETLAIILETLCGLGYNYHKRVLDARNFGLPQKRERVIIVGQRKGFGEFEFDWTKGENEMIPLSEIIESNPAERYNASEHIRKARQEKLNGNLPVDPGPLIYHENKSGNISVAAYACALRAGSSYNYLLVDGKRRLTEREMLRLQGFPDSFKITASYTQVRRQTGNAVPVNMVAPVIKELLRPLTGKFVKTESKNNTREITSVNAHAHI